MAPTYHKNCRRDAYSRPMCRSVADGGRRCSDARRLFKLTAHDLAPHTPGAPDLEWAESDLAEVWENHPQETACAAVKTIEEASAADARTFTDMDTAAQAAGGHLYGTAFRLKSPASLARKINTKQERGERSGAPLTAEDAAATITDTTRYTTVCQDHDQITDTTVATVQTLRANGWEVIRAEQSYLEGNVYKGVHLLVQHTDGQVAELQIHSEISQRIKDKSHPLYEVSRDTSRSRAERLAADREGKALYRQLPAPANLDTLSDRLGVTVSKKRYS